MLKRRRPTGPEKITVKPPERLFLAWGLYWAPPAEVADAEAYGRPMCPWVSLGHLGLAMTAAKCGFALMNTFWGHDEESAEEAISLALSHATMYPETVALFAMGYPEERLTRLGREGGKRLAIANVPIEGKPQYARDALETLPKAGW